MSRAPETVSHYGLPEETAMNLEESVKKNRKWQFTRLRVFSSFMTPYEQRWVTKKLVSG
jgi:hypothetical protein